MAHRIGVSIINFRTPDLTLQSVRSVLDDFGDIDGRVVVVDNASGDDSVEKIEAWLAANPGVPVDFVRSPANTGFAGGHNQGMAACDAEFYLILNSDALVRPGFFRTMLAAAEARPEAGLFAPRLEEEDGTVQTSCFRFPSPVSEFIRGANTGQITQALRRWEVALGPRPDPDRIEWSSFASILLRRSMVDAIGPMDEGYFLYAEDTEYCLRAGRAGWRIAYVPEAAAVHFRGGSGPVKTLYKARKRLPPYHYASRSRFLYQAHGQAGLLLANGLWLAGRGVAQLRRLAGKPVNPRVRGEMRDIWINALEPLGPRRAPGE